jgi:hypothetical protein
VRLLDMTILARILIALDSTTKLLTRKERLL